MSDSSPEEGSHRRPLEEEDNFDTFLEDEAKLREAERARIEEQLRKMRPRWPLRDKGVRPQIDAAMKHKIRKLTRDVMGLVGLKDKELENEMMTSIAKGMAREGQEVFRSPKKLRLRNLGHRSLFKEVDEIDEEVSEEEEPVQEPFPREGYGEEEQSVIYEEDTEEEQAESEDDLLDFLYHPEKYDKYYEKKEPEEKGKKEDDEDNVRDEMVEDEMLGYPWRTFQNFFHGQGEEIGEEDHHKEAGLMGDFGFDIPQWRTTHARLDPEEERRRRRLRRRKICRLTLVLCGNTPRQDLGYMEGWTDSGPELCEKGRKDLETASLALLNRGFKFDMVLTSTLSVSKTVAEKVLEATGQVTLPRLQTSALNPRHLGDLEGQTEAGVGSAWGWMLPLYAGYRGPPIMKETHPHWYHQADGEPTGDLLHPKGETVFHVLARIGVFWNKVKNSFLHEGKRSILVIGHDDSIQGLLFHILALHPTDFSQWEPSTSVPMVFVFEKKEMNFGLAAVDFVTTAEECKRHIVGLCKAMLERHIDKGILDKYAVKEIKKRFYEGRQIPSIDDIYRYKRKEAYHKFESDAKSAGKKERASEALVRQYRHALPEIGVKKLSDFILDLHRASGGEKDNMSVEERVEWIVENVLGVRNKIRLLKDLKEGLPGDSKDVAKIDEIIHGYKEQAQREAEWQKKMEELKLASKNIETPLKTEGMSDWKCEIEALKKGWMGSLPSDMPGDARASN